MSTDESGVHTLSRQMTENLEDLQVDSLKALTMLTGLLGYGALFFIIWPITGGLRPPAEIWGAALICMAGAVGGYVESVRHPRLAAHFFIWCTLIALALTVSYLDSPHYSLVLVIPVIFASVLVGRRGFVFVAMISNVIALTTIVLAMSHAAELLSEFQSMVVGLLSIIPSLLITLCAWLSSSNLNSALIWVWAGYEQAHTNEQLARDRAGELSRALHALEEANFRLDRANYLLALARDRAEEARRLKQEFAQNISHELRTPVNLIIGFAELMTEMPQYYGAPLAPSYQRDLNIIHRNATHLQHMVNDVLDLARIDAAQMSILPEDVDPADLIAETVRTVGALVKRKGLALIVNVARGLPHLWADPTRIRQVIINLINNAARFADEGEITVSASLTDESMLRIAVSDTGVGIASKDLETIFEEFRQADGSVRRRHGGAGLGLAISKRFVEMHGGRIWSESVLGEGSTFTFELPTTHDGMTPPLLPLEQDTGPLGAPHERPMLLAVSQSATASALLIRYRRGFRTLVVPDETEAKRSAQRALPQVILVDQVGRDLEARQVVELARDWDVPNATFVAVPLPDDSRTVSGLDIQGYLAKPVTQEALWEALRSLPQRVERILVVDDELDFVQYLARLLEGNPIESYEVLQALSGREALDVMRYRHPDLVLLDLGLPDIDGAEVIARVRELPWTRETPIIVVSGEGAMEGEVVQDKPIIVYRAQGWLPGELTHQVQAVIDASLISLGSRQERLAENAE